MAIFLTRRGYFKETLPARFGLRREIRLRQAQSSRRTIAKSEPLPA